MKSFDRNRLFWFGLLGYVVLTLLVGVLIGRHAPPWAASGDVPPAPAAAPRIPEPDPPEPRLSPPGRPQPVGVARWVGP